MNEEPKQEEDAQEGEETLQRAAAFLREDEETRELLARIQALEAQGREDESITKQLANRGISRQAALRAWQQHVQDFPEHEHEPTPQALTNQEASLEERVSDAPRNEQTGNPLYDLQSNLSQASDEELYDALQTAQTYIQERGGVTDNEYQALNAFEEELESRNPGYEQPTQAVDNIRNLGKLRIGDSYLRNDNQPL